ncbi:MAG TPA: PAS domain S-box protein, partial [Gemmataceae bacterium]|nr:PAS domain S-box protein [Gemmataceae bacterium]
MPIRGDISLTIVLLFVQAVGSLILVVLCCVLFFQRRRWRRIVRRLAESEDRFRILFEHGGVGRALLSAEGLIVQANPALEQMLGFAPGQLAGQRLSDFSHPDDRHDDTRRMQQRPANPADDQQERERRYLRRDGGVLWARVVRAAVRDEAGRVCYHASVLIDVTERRRAEDALRQAETVLREERDFIALVLQTADALVVVLDRDGGIVRFNAKCAAVSGRTEEEVRGRPVWELLPQRKVESVRVGFAQLAEASAATAAAAPSPLEIPWRTPDGGERLIAWRPSLVFEPDGRVRYVIGVGLDVTDQRRLEEQVRQAQKLETLATLVGGIAHDFNNQLTAVIGNLSLVVEDLRAAGKGDVPADLALGLLAWTESAEQAAQRCAAMTARLLTFSRGRVGSRRPLRLNQLLPEVVRLLRPELPAAMHLEVQAPGDVWPIEGDWAQLNQVLHALAVNARDAMQDDGTLTLTLTNLVIRPEEAAADLEARPGRFVELAVRDDGCGMTPEVRARLFEPFFTTKPPGRGVGLGLSEVYGVIKGHQGWIKVDTAPGRGSTFRLYLPVTAAPVTAASEAPSASGGESVLVVDDEEMVRELARLVLERRGYQVLTASDGEEALNQFSAHSGQIDLVLLDYSMPGLTGLDVFEALRK